MAEDNEETSGELSGDFFAVDARRWSEACADGMNSAVSYLVLCRGTGGDNRTTSWSVSAIETYTGIARPRAQAAIELHIKKGRVEQRRGGRNPKYWISPFESAETEAEWIWLPNTIVDGAAREFSPVELIRQNGNVKALELFVDLYASHLLNTEGGFEWRLEQGIRDPYWGEKVCEWGEYYIWSFSWLGKDLAWKKFAPASKFDSSESFFSSWNLLKQFGLVYAVGHIVQSDSDEGEILHPLPYGDNAPGTPAERDLAYAAYDAAWAMMADWRKERPDLDKSEPLVPVPRHIENVAMVGIYRLLYLPHTRATAKWWGKQLEWAEMADGYRELAEVARGKLPREFKRLQYQGKVKA